MTHKLLYLQLFLFILFSIHFPNYSYPLLFSFIFVYLCDCLFVTLMKCVKMASLFVRLFICLFISVFIHLFICLFIRLFSHSVVNISLVTLFLYLLIYLSIYNTFSTQLYHLRIQASDSAKPVPHYTFPQPRHSQPRAVSCTAPRYSSSRHG